MAGLIQRQTSMQREPQKTSVTQLLNDALDREGMRKRFDELLGKRTPQFISSIVSMVNADKSLQQAFYESPMTVIQASLKAAMYDLPIDQSLGYAYIVPFKNYKKDIGAKRMEASFILGWKGMHQLALRTGAYKTINVVDVREGELKRYNRLTEEVDIDFIEDEDTREALPVIGYVGYYRLINGAEKTIYMSVKAIAAHEEKFRKGEHQGKGWRDDWDAMARKTVYRILIGKWGVMSIDYRTHDAGRQLADVISSDAEEEDRIGAIEAEGVICTDIPDSDPATDEVIEDKAAAQ
jgi:recombination protein RecT